MTNSSISTTVGITLNIISAVADSIVLLISFILLCFVVYRLIYRLFNQGRMSLEVPVILSINTVCILFGKSLIQLVSVAVRTLKQYYQFTIQQNDSFICRFRGYLLLSMVSVLYWIYALQATFRFVRVVCPNRVRLQRSKIYLYIFIPGQYLFAFMSVLPLLLNFNAIRLLTNEDYCTILVDQLLPMIYMGIVTYGLPMSVIFISYTCIIWKMRYSSFIRPYQQRNRRDYFVIRRISVTLVILNIASLPAMIDLLIYAPRSQFDPLAYHIGAVTSSLNSVIFTVSLPFIAPQLYELLKTNRVRPTFN